jgi:membrane-associated phospholipid phosphatase
MRAAEWINILAFSGFLILAWQRRSLGPTRRAKITAIGLVALSLTAITGLVLPRVLDPLPASVIRDWVPYALLLMFYSQAGQFVTGVSVEIQAWLERLDWRIVAPALGWCKRSPAGPWILMTLELAYLLCYVSMPLGLAVLYLVGLRHETDRFWAAVLPATYACYAMLPFVQTQSPRTLPEHRSVQPPPGKVRALNLWILRHASIHSNTCPSAHVASTTACALILMWLAPGLGWIFLVIAILIALGTVTGRYHYFADAVLGVIVAMAAFVLQFAWFDRL